MKSFKEELINKEEIDLTKFTTIIKAPKIIEKIVEKEVMSSIPTPQVIVNAEQGERGIQGPRGKRSTIRINEVTKGKAPLIENIGSEEDAVLNIVLPEGKMGLRGLKGDDGYTPIKGRDYEDGRDGYTPKKNIDYTDGVSATIQIGKVEKGINPSITNSGNETNAVLNFVLPKGDKGDKGEAATINVGEVSTGKKSLVVNTGTTTDVVLNFVLEKGKDGKTPVKGIDYTDGYTPVKGVDYFDGKDGKQGKDGKTPVKGIDYTDGQDGKTPVKGIDYTDGQDGKQGKKGDRGEQGDTGDKGDKGDKGDIPRHELDGRGNIRFENPNNTFGEWINIRAIVEQSVKQQSGKANLHSLGTSGGSNLDFYYNDQIINLNQILKIDDNSLALTLDTKTNIYTLSSYGTSGGGSGSIEYYVEDFDTLSSNIITLTNTPTLNSTQVFLNGVLLQTSSYTLVGQVLTISGSIDSSDWISVKYSIAIGSNYYSEDFINLTSSVITLLHSPINNSVQVYLNGVLLRKTQYTVTNSGIMISSNVIDDLDWVCVKYVTSV